MNNIGCKVSGMVMQCVVDWQVENKYTLPVVLEIGCAEGEGVLRYAGFCKRVVCVDPMVANRPDILDYEGKDHGVNEKKMTDFSKNTSMRCFDVRLIKRSSLADSTVDLVKKELEDGEKNLPIDILVIDGCHHPFEAIKKDFDLYSPLVSKGGFIIFDDTYEDCIRDVVLEVLTSKNFSVHEEWKSTDPGILQWVTAIKKIL